MVMLWNEGYYGDRRHSLFAQEIHKKRREELREKEKNPFLFPQHFSRRNTGAQPYHLIQTFQFFKFKGLILLNPRGKNSYCCQTERVIADEDTLVLAAGNRAEDLLNRRLEGKIEELYKIGHCVAPRRTMDGIHEGYQLAITI